MLATSALSPGEKIWFKNRTLLDYLPLAIFPRYSATINGFQLAKGSLQCTFRLGSPRPGKGMWLSLQRTTICANTRAPYPVC